MATAPTPGPNSGRPTLFRCWRARSRQVVGRDVVDADQPAAMPLAKQAGVDALGHSGAPFEPVLADQHRRVGRQKVDLHIVEMEPSAALGRAAIIAHIMVERALPAGLELAV